MLDILHIVMFRLEGHLGNVRERLLFQSNIVEKNPYILTIGGSVGSTMPEKLQASRVVTLVGSAFLFLELTWVPCGVFLNFSLLQFPTIKMYVLHSFCTRYKLQLLCFSQWHCWPHRVKPRGAKLHFHCQFNHSESLLRRITSVAGPKQVG